MTARSDARRGLLALATAALLAACTSPAAARPSQVATAEPTVSPAPSGDCHQITIDATDIPPDLKMLRKLASEIVVAEFSGFGDAFWATPDGHRPTAEEFATDRARLVRPIEMDVQGELRGHASSRCSPWRRGEPLRPSHVRRRRGARARRSLHLLPPPAREHRGRGHAGPAHDHGLEDWTR